MFPSPLKKGEPLSNMALTKILRTVGLAERATGPRVPQQFQELDPRADGYPLGSFGGGLGSYSGQFNRTSLRKVRFV